MLIEFLEKKAPITQDQLSSEFFDIDFDGEMMVQFQTLKDGDIVAVNAMNGYGDNIQNEVVGVLARIIK